MPQAEVLRVLEIDGQKHLVEDMSPEIQQLVAVYNEWNQDAVDARKAAAQAGAAVDHVRAQLGEQVRKEQAQAAEAQAAADAAANTAAIVEEGLIDPADGEPLIDTE